MQYLEISPHLSNKLIDKICKANNLQLGKPISSPIALGKEAVTRKFSESNLGLLNAAGKFSVIHLYGDILVNVKHPNFGVMEDEYIFRYILK